MGLIDIKWMKEYHKNLLKKIEKAFDDYSLQHKVDNMYLGFYTAGENPSPISAIFIRPGHIDETISPRLLSDNTDLTNTVDRWKWTRKSHKPGLDEYWNSQSKASQRELHLTEDDFPQGWELQTQKISFTCTATIVDGNEEYEIINKILL